MAQAIPLNAVVELTAFSTYQNQTVMNVFHYHNALAAIPLPDGDNELQNLMSKFESTVWDDIANGWRMKVSSGFVLQALRAQVVTPGRQYYQQLTVNEAGALLGISIPSDTNITLSLRTAGAIRGMTGNKKFTGLELSSISGNAFTNPTITSWQPVGTLIRTTLTDIANADRWVPIVWSRLRPSDRRLIVGGTVQQEVRVLRRRQKGLGV